MLINNFKLLFKKEEYINTNDEYSLSQAITWLRFPLALLVILIHVNPQSRDIFTPISTINLQHLSIENIYSIIGRFGSYFSRIAVPFFFFTSGYYFFYKLKEWNYDTYNKKVKKRIKTLLIPYILWNILTLLFLFLTKTLGVIIQNKPVEDFFIFVNDFRWSEIFWNYSTWNIGKLSILGISTQMYGPILLPLWFLRDLIVVTFIFSPIIYYGIKYLKLFFIFLLCVACLAGISILNMNFIGLLFFSIGSYFSINHKNILSMAKKYRNIFLIFSIISLILCVYFDENALSDVFLLTYRIMGIPIILYITLYLLRNKLVFIYKNLSRTSFLVYALHTMVILKFSCLSLAIVIIEKCLLVSRFTIGYIFAYFLSPLFCALLCLIIFILLKIYLPKLLVLLTGDRL